MITIVTNLIFALLAFAVSSGVALHDSRFDTVFATAVSPAADTAVHDLGHAIGHDLHVHGSRHTLNESVMTDPSVRERSHKKHVTLHHARTKLAMLGA